MIDSVSDRRPPVSPQLAIRVAALGVVAFMLFAIIFFRLWYLQVLSGDQYLAQAQTNKVRVQPLPAPRGSIVDRNGDTIVGNESAIVVKIRPDSLPASEKKAAADYGDAVIARSQRPKGSQGAPIVIPEIPQDLAPRFRRLATTLAMPTRRIQEIVVRGLFLAGYAPITVREGVDESVQGYIAERQEEFPGVSVDRAFIRTYPGKELAAQILGTVGQVSQEQLDAKTFPGVTLGSIVGKTGIEREYDKYLRGRDGKERILVDAQGNPRGEGLRIEPKPGNDLQLTLDLGVQRTGQVSYASIAGSKPGAFVAMDPRNGDVIAMGSFPSFDPSLLAKPISQKQYDRIFNDGSTPQFNRATGANYATGSTFKPITALAGLEDGKISTTDTINDQGCLKIGVQERCNAKKAVFGPVDLRDAMKVSSDIYFYLLGQSTNTRDPDGGAIQRVARKFGFERQTGIDLPSESQGLVPDPTWRKKVGEDEKQCRRDKGIPQDASLATAGAGGCAISDGRQWSIGDNVSLSIGQGDLQATPLQMAVAYAGFAQSGRIPRPRLGRAVTDDRGALIQTLPASGGRSVKIDPEYRDAIMDGLHLAASAEGGTSTSVFDGWNQSRFPVFGKTGTAQVTTRVLDQSWYLAYSYDGPDKKRPIVVAVTVEDGGFGAETAAPIACQILKRWFATGGTAQRNNNRAAACAAGTDVSF
ncbi:Peptidoglycan D,D-transpeptidase MrdA [Paraconexibacter sp. AEG42_29]|uniref:Peptidoglycan D,D-transpeptidase MrdA n=1 Tax=Paraconexibacter sp. AEG42_29 TaxID=2997339 RepID=A0AAU7AXM2_9ACTN